VYAEQPNAFDGHAEQLLTLFAAQSAVLVANVATAERAQKLTEGLRQAVLDPDQVGVAKGVLMARHGIDEDTAFGMLLARATQDSATLRDVARTVADSAVRRRR
jgi:AmiR/NasT family two-component response regulator